MLNSVPTASCASSFLHHDVVDRACLGVARAKAMPPPALLRTAWRCRTFCLRIRTESPIMGTTFATCTHKWVLVLPADHTFDHRAQERRLWPVQARYHQCTRLIAFLEIALPSAPCVHRSATWPPSTPWAIPMSPPSCCMGKLARGRAWWHGSFTTAVHAPRDPSSM